MSVSKTGFLSLFDQWKDWFLLSLLKLRKIREKNWGKHDSWFGGLLSRTHMSLWWCEKQNIFLPETERALKCRAKSRNLNRIRSAFSRNPFRKQKQTKEMRKKTEILRSSRSGNGSKNIEPKKSLKSKWISPNFFK